MKQPLNKFIEEALENDYLSFPRFVVVEASINDTPKSRSDVPCV